MREDAAMLTLWLTARAGIDEEELAALKAQLRSRLLDEAAVKSIEAVRGADAPPPEPRVLMRSPRELWPCILLRKCSPQWWRSLRVGSGIAPLPTFH
jgi:hypothetical protein